eukprot:g1009.t1
MVHPKLFLSSESEKKTSKKNDSSTSFRLPVTAVERPLHFLKSSSIVKENIESTTLCALERELSHTSSIIRARRLLVRSASASTVDSMDVDMIIRALKLGCGASISESCVSGFPPSSAHLWYSLGERLSEEKLDKVKELLDNSIYHLTNAAKSARVYSSSHPLRLAGPQINPNVMNVISILRKAKAESPKLAGHVRDQGSMFIHVTKIALSVLDNVLQENQPIPDSLIPAKSKLEDALREASALVPSSPSNSRSRLSLLMKGIDSFLEQIAPRPYKCNSQNIDGKVISIPGASSLQISFDRRCRDGPSSSTLTFFHYEKNKRFEWIQSRDNFCPFLVNGNALRYSHHSDIKEDDESSLFSTNDWGFAFRLSAMSWKYNNEDEVLNFPLRWPMFQLLTTSPVIERVYQCREEALQLFHAMIYYLRTPNSPNKEYICQCLCRFIQFGKKSTVKLNLDFTLLLPLQAELNTIYANANGNSAILSQSTYFMSLLHLLLNYKNDSERKNWKMNYEKEEKVNNERGEREEKKNDIDNENLFQLLFPLSRVPYWQEQFSKLNKTLENFATNTPITRDYFDIASRTFTRFSEFISLILQFERSLRCTAQIGFWTNDLRLFWIRSVHAAKDPASLSLLLLRFQESITLEVRDLAWFDIRESWEKNMKSACTVAEIASLLLPFEKYLVRKAMYLQWAEERKDWRRAVESFTKSNAPSENRSRQKSRKKKEKESVILPMRLVHCDGGEEIPGIQYCCKNILNDNESVYCSKKTCNVNIVCTLTDNRKINTSPSKKRKSTDDDNGKKKVEEEAKSNEAISASPFSSTFVSSSFIVKKIIARKPSRNFTCPIESGLIFIFPTEPTQQEIEETNEKWNFCSRSDYNRFLAKLQNEEEKEKATKTDPVAFFDIPPATCSPWGEVAIVPDRYVEGCFVLIKLLRSFHRQSCALARNEWKKQFNNNAIVENDDTIAVWCCKVDDRIFPYSKEISNAIENAYKNLNMKEKSKSKSVETFEFCMHCRQYVINFSTLEQLKITTHSDTANKRKGKQVKRLLLSKRDVCKDFWTDGNIDAEYIGFSGVKIAKEMKSSNQETTITTSTAETVPNTSTTHAATCGDENCEGGVDNSMMQSQSFTSSSLDLNRSNENEMDVVMQDSPQFNSSSSQHILAIMDDRIDFLDEEMYDDDVNDDDGDCSGDDDGGISMQRNQLEEPTINSPSLHSTSHSSTFNDERDLNVIGSPLTIDLSVNGKFYRIKESMPIYKNPDLAAPRVGAVRSGEIVKALATCGLFLLIEDGNENDSSWIQSANVSPFNENVSSIDDTLLQYPFSCSDAISNWTLDADQEVVQFITELMQRRGRCLQTFSSMELLNSSLTIDPHRFPLISKMKKEKIAARYDVLKIVNRTAEKFLSLLDFSKVSKFRIIENEIETFFSSKSILFLETKMNAWKKSFKQTYSKQKSSEVVTVNRYKALRDHQIKNSIFVQIHTQLFPVDPSLLRRSDQKAWFVKFQGEPAIDDGGLYRESVSSICEELQSSKTPLFLPCGVEKAKFVPNVAALQAFPEARDWFVFIGRLMGIATQSLNSTFPLDLSSHCWKYLAHESIEKENDLKELDDELYRFVQYLRRPDLSREEFDATCEGMEWNVTTMDGRILPLPVEKNQKSIVTFSDRYKYASKLETFRLNEAKLALDCIEKGLSQIVPSKMLPIFSSKELSLLVCGSPDIDLNLLKRKTVFGPPLHKKHRLVSDLWSVLESFTSLERQKFLLFVWGRSRLPARESDFGCEKFKIVSMSEKRNKSDTKIDWDQYLPTAHTCFFQLELPLFSNKEILREKLLYSMSNAKTIDDNVNQGDSYNEVDS